MAAIMVVVGGKVKKTCSGLKMLEALITDVFLLSGFSFTNIHDSQDNQVAISLTLRGGQIFLDNEFLGRLL